MRHKIAGNRLSRNRSLRKATLRDLAKATLFDQRICTTRAKAKEGRRLVEKLITLGKKDTLAARRSAFAILCDHSLVSSLFKDIAPRFKNRMGGYTRIIPLNNRIGDNATMVFLELTEKDRVIISGQKAKNQNQEEAPAVEEAQVKPAAKPEHSKADLKSTPKSAAKPKAAPKMFQRKTGGE